MDNNNRTYVFSRARNTRIAFLVDIDCSIALLKKIMTDNYKIWGGGYNPIIPITNNDLTPLWADLLEQIDPDIIYYSTSIDIQKIQNSGLKVYPRLFNIIPDNGVLNLSGVNPFTFIDSFFKYNLGERRHVSLPYFVPGLNHVLKDFFSLNFGIREIYAEDDEYLQEIRKTAIYDDNINTSLSLMWSRSGFMQNLLCNFHIGNEILDAQRWQVHQFELIIYDDKNSFEDLIYYWNRKLYQTPSSKIMQIAISKTEFELLANDSFFHWILNHSAGKNRIYVTSRSFNSQELTDILDVCIPNNYVIFKIVPLEDFPAVYSSIKQSTHQHWIKKVLQADEDFINIPDFPIGEHIRLEGDFELDVRINNTGSFQLSTFRFPNGTMLRGLVSDTPGRVNKYNSLSFHIEGRTSGLDFRLPLVSDIITSRLQIRDKAGEIQRPSGLTRCVPSRAGLLLSTFMNLFNGNWALIQKNVLDRFWLEVFTGTGKYHKIKEVYSLEPKSIINESEKRSKPNLFGKLDKGDGLFSYKDLQHELKCIYNLYYKEIVSKVEDKEEGYKISDLNTFTLDCYSSDVKSILDAISYFIKVEAIFIGLKVKCNNCGSKLWYSLNELSNRMTCKGCNFDIRAEPETPFYYKVNDTVINNLMSDPVKRTKSYGGNYVVLEVLNYLREGYSDKIVNSFGYSPSLDIYLDHKDFRKTDLDILAIQNGKLIVGEAKLNASEMDEQQIKQLIWIGNEIRPDVIMIAYKNGNLKEGVINKIRQGITQPNVDVQELKICEPVFRFGAMSWLPKEGVE